MVLVTWTLNLALVVLSSSVLSLWLNSVIHSLCRFLQVLCVGKISYPLWRLHFLLLNLQAHTAISNSPRKGSPLLSSDFFPGFHLPSYQSFAHWMVVVMSASAWSSLEFSSLHYPKLYEIEGNTAGPNPGAIRLTSSRYWWLTVY